MTGRASEAAEVTGVLDRAAGLDQAGGDDRLKNIVRQVTGHFCRTIERSDVAPTEFWTAVDTSAASA